MFIPFHKFHTFVGICVALFVLLGNSACTATLPGTEIAQHTEIPPTQVNIAPEQQSTPAAGPTVDTIPPVLINYRPGENEIVMLDTPIWLEFSQAMNPDSVIDALNITPETIEDWIFEWQNDRTLQISPGLSGFHAATQYHVRIMKQAQSIDGLRLNKEYNLSFTTVPPLEVTATYPPDAAYLSRADVPLQITFNQAMVDHACVAAAYQGREDCQPSILEFSPQIPGSGRWLKDALYEFIPHHNWTAGETYEVTISQGVSSLAGLTLPDVVRWTFTFDSPKIVSISPSADAANIELDSAVQIWFSTPMNEPETAEAVIVRSLNGDIVPGIVSWSDNGDRLSFRPVNPFALETTYIVYLGKHARAISSTPIENTVTWRFTTLPYPEVINIEPPDGTPAFPHGEPVRIQFAGAIDKTSLLRGFTITPELETQEIFYDPTDTTLIISGQVTPTQEYCLTLSNSVADKYGNTLSEPVRSCFTAGNRRSEFSLVGNGMAQTLQANAPSYLYFNNLNTSDVNFILYEINERQYFQQNNLADANILREWSSTFDPQMNTVETVRVSLQDFQGTLPTGFYGLTWEAVDLPPQTAFFTVVDLNVATKMAVDEVLTWVTDMSSGVPISRTAVSFYDFEGNLMAGGTTDDSGLVSIKIQDHYTSLDEITAVLGEPGTAGFGLGRSQYDVSFSSESGAQHLTSGTYPKYKAFIWTEHTNYSPGQVISYFGYLFERDVTQYRLNLNQQRVNVNLFNAQDVLVLKTQATVSPQGLFKGHLALDNIIPEGDYTLRLTIAETEEIASGDAIIRVYLPEPFEREISVQAVSSEAIIGDIVKFNVSMVDTSGDLTSNTDFRWFVVTAVDRLSEHMPTAESSTDDVESQYSWNNTLVTHDSQVVIQGVGTTNTQGQATILVPTENLQDFVNTGSFEGQIWRIVVQATDEDNRSGMGEAIVRMRVSQYHLGIRAQKRFINLGEKLSVELIALDDTLLPIQEAHLFVSLMKINTQTGQLDDINNDSAVTEEAIEVITDNLGEASVIFTPKLSGAYVLAVSLEDNNGIVIHAREKVVVVPKDDNIQRENLIGLVPIADQTMYGIGEVARILLPIASENPYQVLMTVERENILYREVQQYDRSNPIIEIPILDNYAPKIYVTFTVIIPGADGQSITQSGTIEVKVYPSKDALHVQIIKDQDPYLAGHQALVRIRITDDAGLPVDAEVLITIQKNGNVKPFFSEDFMDLAFRNAPLQVSSSPTILMSTDTISDVDTITPSLVQSMVATPLNPISLPDGFDEQTRILHMRSYMHQAVNGEVLLTVDMPNDRDLWQILVIASTKDGLLGVGNANMNVSSEIAVVNYTPNHYTAEDRSAVISVIRNLTGMNRDVTMNYNPISGNILLTENATKTIQLDAYEQQRVVWPIYIDPDRQWTMDYQILVSSSAVTHTYNANAGEGITILNPALSEMRSSSHLLIGESNGFEIVQIPENAGRATSLSSYYETSIEALFESSLEYVMAFPVNTTDVLVDRIITHLNYYRYRTGKFVNQIDTDETSSQSLLMSLDTLCSRQNEDGGWGLWQNPSDLYITAYAAMGLLRAVDAGYDTCPEALEPALNYLTFVISGTLEMREIDVAVPYGLYTLSLLDRDWPANAASRLYTGRENLGVYSKTYLALALWVRDPADPRIETLLQSILTSVHTSSDYGYYWPATPTEYDQTDTRVTATVLDFLLKLGNDTLDTAPVINWLIHSRDGKFWKSTHDTAAVLEALTNYFELGGTVTSTFEWTAELNTNSVYNSAAQTITDTVYESTFDLGTTNGIILDVGENILTVERTSGLGRLYWATNLNMAFSQQDIKPMSRGISLSKQLCSLGNDLNDSLDYIQDDCHPVEAIKKGDILVVRLTVFIPENISYMTLIDYLPSGFVPYYTGNNGHMTTGNQSLETMVCDELRCMFFDAGLDPGYYQVVYQAKATFTGQYYVLPARVYAAHNPAVWAQGQSFPLTVLESATE